MKFLKKIPALFAPYNRVEITLKILGMIIGVGYVLYAYLIDTGLGTMVPRYAGY